MAGRHCLELQPADLTGQHRIEPRLILRRAHRASRGRALADALSENFRSPPAKGGRSSKRGRLDLSRMSRDTGCLAFAGMTAKVSGATGFMPRRTLIQYFR
jgi:hypothetical protein